MKLIAYDIALFWHWNGADEAMKVILGLFTILVVQALVYAIFDSLR